MDYLAVSITFFAAFLAIRGGTWDETGEGLKRVTKVGLAVAFLAISSYILSIYQTSKNNSEKNASNKAKNEAYTRIKGMSLESKRIELDVSESQRKLRLALADIDALKAMNENQKRLLEHYGSIFLKLETESSRQPQIVMSEYIDLRENEFRLFPNSVYGGTTYEIFGPEYPILLVYGDRPHIRRVGREIERILPFTSRYEWDSHAAVRLNDELRELSERYSFRHQVITPGWRQDIKGALIGGSGVSMNIAVLNLVSQSNSLKIFMQSTPRVRSPSRSWLEEVSISDNIPNSGPAKVIASKSLNVRETPDLNGPIIFRLDNGESVIVEGKKNYWVKVRCEDKLGWCYGGFLETQE